MKVTEDLLNAATEIIQQNSEMLENEQSIIASIGCFGCGMGCSDTVGG